MTNTKKLPVFQPTTPLQAVTRDDCSPAAWALLAQMSNRIVQLQDQLRAARAVICEQQGHLPMSGSTGTWCETCHKRID